MESIIRVNLTSNKITTEPVVDKYQKLGGRALTSQILYDEVDPTCEPLGSYNKLAFAPGLLGGSHLSSSSRLSIGGKSPLTGGIKESNAGGTAAQFMCKLGIKAIIIEGASKVDHSHNLYISKDTIELVPSELDGMGIYRSADLLFERYGNEVSPILIGPAGERGYSSAGISNCDPQGRPSRFCGRGGLGAVMGVKGLKAIILDSNGAEGISYYDRKAFMKLNKEMVKTLRENPGTGETFPKYGTAALTARTHSLYALPTRNFSQGNFEDASQIDGERLYEIIQSRGGSGSPTHSCMPGCVIKCSNIFADSSGNEVVGPLEYETIGLLGPNCGIGNLDDIAKLNYICNDLGVDTIEIGAAIGVAMEQGLASFGDTSAAVDLLYEVSNDTVLGKVLAQGALITGRVFGSRRIPVVKGQAMAAYDPRAIKGTGTTYATSPMGADHTAGNTIRAQVEHTDPVPNVELSRKSQRLAMFADSMGLCIFVLGALGTHLDKLANMLEFYKGLKFSDVELLEAATQALRVEREFNRLAGIGEPHDRIPEYMTEEKLPGINSNFDVSDESLKKVFE